MDLAFIGGSFDPFHFGHANIIESLAEKFPELKLLIVPSYLPPHKENTVPYEHRLKMTRLAIRALKKSSEINFENVEISNIEKSLSSPSYSYKTLEKLKKKYKPEKTYIVVGFDMFQSLDEWVNYEKLTSENSFIIYNRKTPEKNDMKIKAHVRNIERDENEAIFIDNKKWDVSSTKIRNMLVNKKKNIELHLKNFLPESIIKYIIVNDLYR